MAIPLPAHDVIQVWRRSVSDAPIDELSLVLSDEEMARASRFAFDKDRHQFIAARGTLRRLLGDYLAIPADAVQFEYGSAGKPVVAESQRSVDVRFNLSHSGDVVLFAFARGRDVGVDVEYFDLRVHIENLAKICFSIEEHDALFAGPVDQRVERFFRYWTAKEAYIKWLGDGLSAPLQEFTVDIRSATTSWPVKTLDPDVPNCTVQQLPVPGKYAAALAAESGTWRVEMLDASSQPA